MLSIVFNLKYLSKNFIKFNIQGVFWNPQDEQISKLTLVIKFDQDLMEKKRKTSWLILTDTGCRLFNWMSFLLLKAFDTLSIRRKICKLAAVGKKKAKAESSFTFYLVVTKGLIYSYHIRSRHRITLQEYIHKDNV